MNSRERVLRCIGFTGPDKIPVGYYATPASLLTHGQALVDWLDRYPNDFYDNADIIKIPVREITDLFASLDGGLMYSIGIGYEVPLVNIATMLAAFEECRNMDGSGDEDCLARRNPRLRMRRFLSNNLK